VLWDMLWGETAGPAFRAEEAKGEASDDESPFQPLTLARSVSTDSTDEDNLTRLEAMFPVEVTAGALKELTLLGRRLDGTGARHTELRAFVRNSLSAFLAEGQMSLPERREALSQAKEADSRNMVQRARLQRCGYSPELWNAGSEFRVDIGSGDKKLTGRILLGLLESALSCGDGMLGCYAPDAGRREKPLEVGLRDDCLFLSVETADGEEIENCEVLLCDEAAYIYQAYAKPHSHSTAAVWASLLVHLVRSGLVPAVAVRSGHPTSAAHKLLRRSLDAEEWGGELTYMVDFWQGCASYYDHAPSLRPGEDLMLTFQQAAEVSLPAVTLAGPAAKAAGRVAAPAVKPVQSLPCTLTRATMGRLSAEPNLKCLCGAIGGNVLRWHRSLLTLGTMDDSILFEAVDLQKLNSQKADGSPKRDAQQRDAAWFEAARLEVARIVRESFAEQMMAHDLALLCSEARLSELLELLAFSRKATPQLRHLGIRSREVRESLRVVPLGSMPAPRGTMLWIHRQEDRAWRDRGGRPTHETSASFLALLDGEAPGVVALCGQGVHARPVGYVVGEHVGGQYEIVCAWVHESMRGLGLAMDMYCSLLAHSGASELLCDVKVGTTGHLGLKLPRSFAALLQRVCIKSRKSSYSFESATGEREEFEKLVVRSRPLQLAVACLRRPVWSHCSAKALQSIAALALLFIWYCNRRRLASCRAPLALLSLLFLRSPLGRAWHSSKALKA